MILVTLIKVICLTSVSPSASCWVLATESLYRNVLILLQGYHLGLDGKFELSTVRNIIINSNLFAFIFILFIPNVLESKVYILKFYEIQHQKANMRCYKTFFSDISVRKYPNIFILILAYTNIYLSKLFCGF